MATCQSSHCWGVALFLMVGLCFLTFESLALMKEHACKSIDIRNSVRNFAKLQNCTVIEGNLKILLIDSAQASDYENLTFPNLREITDYFLLFRVNGLRSLRKIFPNLSVIRGTKLFYNYAFVVFEMLSLEEIGLPRLTHIMRGDVRIEKNPDLCYVETIDWSLITRKPIDLPTIKGNKKAEECPDQCPDKGCPHSRGAAGDRNSKLCWSENDCQKVCNTTACGTNSCRDDNPNLCCHPECLGGCSGTLTSECFVCNEIFFDGFCTTSCVEGTYRYQGRRCLDFISCKAQTVNVTNAESQNITLFYKPFDGVCTYECPSGYMVDPTNPHNCTKCPKGLCPKVCLGDPINNVADAQRFVGCTVIHGSLEIHITGGNNVVAELHKSLGMVEVITGYLKIVRSYPIMSFDFLRNLRVIKGENKHDDGYSLYVLDNQNLQNLWTWEKRNHSLVIEDGRMFFHFNPKLCLEKIRELQRKTGLVGSDSHDVSPHSNGDRAACNVTKLDFWIESNSKIAVIVRWRNVAGSLADPRELLGYTVSYKEAPGTVNLTTFDDFDACATDSWRVEDVPSHEGKDQLNVTHLITHLKPFTRYGIFVKTSMVAQAQFGALSDLKHFVTSPDNPSIPVELKAWSNSSSILIVNWKPPQTPNGLVTHYVVIGEIKQVNQNFLDLRNFCSEQMRYVTNSEPDPKPKATVDVIPDNLNSTCRVPGGKCCACPKDKKELEQEERKRQSEIAFENYLHNVVYIPRPNWEGERKRRDTDDASEHLTIFGEDNLRHHLKRSIAERNPAREVKNNSLPTLNAPLLHNSKLTNNAASDLEGVALLLSLPDYDGNSTFKKTVNDTGVVLDKLLHFSEYTIKVFACHDAVFNSTQSKLCSNEAIATARTKPFDGADDIPQSTITATVNNQTSSSVHIKWKAPSFPNGVVVIYHIGWEKQGTKATTPICVPHKMFLEQNGHTIDGLIPGNYTLKIRATSLSGAGNWSAPISFLIPEPSRSWGAGVIVGIAVAVLFVLALVASFTWYLTKKRRQDNPVNANGVVSVNPEYFSADGVYMPDEWEVPREKITLLKELGQGSFGMVYEGIARDIVEGKPVAPCAVKTVNESATMRERFEFLNEASVMKTFQCFHVVKLLGVVSKGQPILVVMELMANGDLKSYLRSHRPDEGNPETQPPTLKKIMQMALEIADGMAYLSNRKYVHRDLAARNCMVAEDLTVKIGDFGMTRDIYENDYYRKGGKGLLPVRWMAPESLKDGVFTSQSDVWSYGIVLWEMATLASQPYQGLTNEQVLKYVIEGGVIEQPENCPEILYFLMQQCWLYNPKMRLTFIQIIETLINEASPSFKDCSFYHSPRDAPPPPSGAPNLAAYGQTSPVIFDEEDDEDDEEDEMMDTSPSTPLRSPPREISQPLRTTSMQNSSAPEGGRPAGTTTSLVGSSDGSKDSRTSNCSANGSVLNGRPGMWSPLTKDTKC